MTWPRNPRSGTMLCTTPFTEQRKLALTRIERGVGGPGGTTEQEDKYIRVSSLRNRRFTSPQLATSLNSTSKIPVSTSTVTRRLLDAGLLSRVAKKMTFLRLANKNKRLRWTKEHRHRTEIWLFLCISA